jgi:cytidylate kinase
MDADPRKVIITIDGPAGSGKSTLARGLARELGITYLNTGAMYRALALKALENRIDPSDEVKSVELAASTKIDFTGPDDSGECSEVFLDGQNVTGLITTNVVSRAASMISRHPGVREAMVRLQREIAEGQCNKKPQTAPNAKINGVVIEGRDTGTVVFPDADVKIYLEASLEERAKRRLTDFHESEQNLEKVKTEIFNRDLSDLKRPVGALKPAPDAHTLDNTDWSRNKTLARALEIVRDHLAHPTG